jgi:glycosyltransferase involved in cell wall biosynthesis
MWWPGRGNCATPCFECRLFATPRRALSAIPTAVTCVSHRVFDRLTEAGAFRRARDGAQPVRIIRGNNPGAISPDTAVASSGEALTLGFMARIEPAKGLGGLLDALGRFAPGRVRLLVAGLGQRATVDDLRRQVRPESDVQFLGHVAPDEFFPRIDCLVIPSVWEDPFPRVFHEALAYGVPSLVTPLGGLPEVIRPGQTGFVASGSDAAALQQAIARLLDPGWNRPLMREACRAAAAAYAPARIVAQYAAVLRAAATGGAVPDDAGEVWRRRGAAEVPLAEAARDGA